MKNNNDDDFNKWFIAPLLGLAVLLTIVHFIMQFFFPNATWYHGL